MSEGLGGVAARGGSIILASQLIRLVIMLASTVLLARLISPDSYGLFAMVAALVALADVLRDMGLSMVALRSPDLTSGQKSNLFWLSVLSGFVLAAAVFLAAPLVSGFYSEPALVGVTEILAVTFLINSIAAQFRVQINRDMRFGVLALTDLVPYAGGFVVALILALRGAQYWALTWQLVTVAVLTLIMSMSLARWFPGLPRRGQRMRKLLTFGSAYVGSQLVTYGMRNADSIAIGRVWGPVALGPYDRAYQLMMIPINNVISPLGRVAIPVMARVRGVQFATFSELAHLAIAYLTVGPYLLVAGLSSPLVLVLLGPQWSAAVPLLSILAVGGAFRAIAQISNWMYVAVGGAARFLRLQIVSQLGIVVFMLVGVIWGPVGVAVGHSVGFAIYWLVTLTWTGRELHVDVRPLLRDGFRIFLLLGIPLLLIGFSASALPLAAFLQCLVAVGGAALWLAVVFVSSSRVRGELSAVRRLRRRPQ